MTEVEVSVWVVAVPVGADDAIKTEVARIADASKRPV